MPLMKAFLKAAAPAALLLTLCACTSTRAGKAAPAPDAQVAAPASTADAEAAAAAQQDAQKEKSGGSTFFGRFFSSLFGSSDKTEAQPADDKKDAPQANAGEQVAPSPEQQEAALRLLAEQGPDIPEPTVQDVSVQGVQAGPLTMGLPQFGDDSAGGIGTAGLGSGGSALPAAPGLRIRNLAPPEEAISTDGRQDAPKPNSAEMKGLRSISLPENLPMDINGKLTTDKR